MAKGIIVMDDIPVICAECSFAHLTQNKQYFHPILGRIPPLLSEVKVGDECRSSFLACNFNEYMV